MPGEYKKVLVTGGNGQLGSEIRNLSFLHKNFSWEFTDIEELDVSSQSDVGSFFQGRTYDFIINCAAYTAVDKAEADTEAASRLNTLAPGYLVNSVKPANTRIIHISTDFVFDGNKNTPYRETDPTNPLSVYGKTKRDGEKILLDQAGSSMIIRTSWLYSVYGNNFVKSMIRFGGERDYLNVVFDQAGSPTSASDLAGFILKIVQSPVEFFQPGIFHFSNEGIASWYDFARFIIAYLGIQCEVNPILTEQYPTPAKRPSYSVLDKSKTKETFGIKISHWQDSLVKCLEVLKRTENQ